ncbi:MULTISPECIES: TetR/AcrR family transcriptional regulator [Haloferax]|nr:MULTISPECIES: TetR family transcriptional regulator C-terminal domain-containing protein [Haloferax]MDS0242112.1 TetR/AcrR family transcriptional regulator [Haloferax sp. S2CR25]MDS0445233.1 TetR/AcrR family transcriptional regulator [Haloferax sp. S2CR25-2]
MEGQLDSMDKRAPLFVDEPDDTKTEILKATFDALAEHGYANLTIDRISQHFSKSEGLVFYHYDGKDDVLLDLLNYLLSRFRQVGMPVSDDGDPETRLRSLFDQVIPEPDEQQIRDYETVLTELRMRAAQDEAFQECFNQSQDIFRETIREILQDGIESGDFREMDPELVANFLVTLVSGRTFERVTTGISRPIQSELDNYIKYRLLADAEDNV